MLYQVEVIVKYTMHVVIDANSSIAANRAANQVLYENNGEIDGTLIKVDYEVIGSEPISNAVAQRIDYEMVIVEDCDGT